MGDSKQEVTELLRAWTAGDLEARDRAMALVYHELRRRAATHLRRERSGHTLQPTALVHEAHEIAARLSSRPASREASFECCNF